MSLAATVVPPPPAQGLPTAADKANPAFTVWSERFAEDIVRLDPELATQKQYFEGPEQAALDRQLTPRTAVHRAKLAAMREVGIRRLKQWEKEPLNATQRVTAAVMLASLESQADLDRIQDYYFEFNQMGGTHIDLVQFMTQVHPLRRAADVPAYLARLAQVSTRIDEAIACSRAATDKGLLPPRFILERAQAQVGAFLAPPSIQNVLVVSLVGRTAGLADLAPPEQAAAIAEADRIVAGQVLPAFNRLKDYLAKLHPRTSDVAGLSHLPGGIQAYATALASFTGSNMTADEIHALGLREVARIEGEMDRHLKTLGFVDGSITARMAALDASLQPSVGTDPRPQLLERYRAIKSDAEVRSGTLFNLRPRASLTVLREPELTEATASAHYTWPSQDGTRPGTFWVPLAGPQFKMASMRSLTYHEGIRGHHFQLALQQEMPSLPKFRRQRIFGGGSSHSEGWALYAEYLAIEQGWYDGDLPGLLGALDAQLFRARRLVVDTGLHSKGWSRQRAIDYGINAQEVERYVAIPGQACAYMTGMLRIVEMRERARTALGPKFSLQGFHDVVLTTGSVPLTVLAKVLDDEVAAQLARPLAGTQ